MQSFPPILCATVLGIVDDYCAKDFVNFVYSVYNAVYNAKTRVKVEARYPRFLHGFGHFQFLAKLMLQISTDFVHDAATMVFLGVASRLTMLADQVDCVDTMCPDPAPLWPSDLQGPPKLP